MQQCDIQTDAPQQRIADKLAAKSVQSKKQDLHPIMLNDDGGDDGNDGDDDDIIIK